MGIVAAGKSEVEAPLTVGVPRFAKMLGVSEESVRRIVATPGSRPPGFFVGTTYRVIVSEIDGWLHRMSDGGRAL